MFCFCHRDHIKMEDKYFQKIREGYPLKKARKVRLSEVICIHILGMKNLKT